MILYRQPYYFESYIKMVVHTLMNELKFNKYKNKIIWIHFMILDTYLHKTSILELLSNLTKIGNDVTLLAIRSKKRFLINKSDIYLSHERHNNIHFILIPLRYMPIISSILFSIIVFIILPFYIIIKKPNFIIMEPGLHIMCSFWRYIFYPLKVKFILDIRSTPVELTSFRKNINSILFSISVIIAKKIDGITIITSNMRKYISNEFYIPQKFIKVWTSGVSVTLFKCEKYNEKIVRERLNLINKFIFFYHGYFGLKRGLIECVKSIVILKDNYQDIVLFFLGEGPVRPILEKLIRENGIQDRVIIHDSVDYNDVPKYISICDVGLVPLPNLPDWRYQCPLKLLEYLSMKKTVIITDIPAHTDIIGNNKFGIYVHAPKDKFVDPRDIAEAMIFAYNNKMKIKEWGFDGRKIIEEKYDWIKIAKTFENHLLEITRARR